MAIDTATVTLLNSTLGSPATRRLFTTIAASRIALLASLKEAGANEEELSALQGADLIGANSSGEKFYVTAKGLKVARDLEQLTI
jgi:hypothetical protein